MDGATVDGKSREEGVEKVIIIIKETPKLRRNSDYLSRKNLSIGIFVYLTGREIVLLSVKWD
jgi:hypothetical protein